MISLMYMFFICVSVCVGDASVKYAAVIYRHGDRTPVDPYPTDPWRNESLWPVKFGELTNIGLRQHYALGQWLRDRYSHLLSESFDPDEIYVRSTDVDRTLMSAQANLAGMYPPNGNSIWDPDLLWRPIPVHTVPEKEDEVLSMKKPCPTYIQEFRRLINSKTYKERLSKYQKLMDYLSAYTGMKVKDYVDIDSIYSVLNIESLYNLTLPDWTRPVFPDKMVEPAGYSFTEDTATPLLARLKIGPLIKQIMHRMMLSMTYEKQSDETKSKSPLKLSIYSAHDLTIASVLNGLGMFDGKCPEYTSTIFMELIHDDATSTHFIRISYRNTTEIVEPHVLRIPLCGELCPVERFMKLYDNLLTVDWEYECEKQFPALLGMSFFIGLGLFATIYILHKIHFARMAKQHRLSMSYCSLRHSAPVLPVAKVVLIRN